METYLFLPKPQYATPLTAKPTNQALLYKWFTHSGKASEAIQFDLMQKPSIHLIS